LRPSIVWLVGVLPSPFWAPLSNLSFLPKSSPCASCSTRAMAFPSARTWMPGWDRIVWVRNHSPRLERAIHTNTIVVDLVTAANHNVESMPTMSAGTTLSHSALPMVASPRSISGMIMISLMGCVHSLRRIGGESRLGRSNVVLEETVILESDTADTTRTFWRTRSRTTAGSSANGPVLTWKSAAEISTCASATIGTPSNTTKCLMSPLESTISRCSRSKIRS
jgi:hypothetical protein